MACLDPASQLIRAEVERLLPYLESSDLNGKRIFITGGTGFFGYWMLAALRSLVDLGREIRVTVLSRSPERFLQQNPEFRGAETWLSFQKGDVRELGVPREPHDWYIHGATDTSLAAHARPLEIFETLVSGTYQVLEHARKAAAQRVLLLSSGAIYGTGAMQGGAIAEESRFGPSPMDPSQAYAEGKRAMEMAGALYNAAGLVEVISARCFAFVGPRLPLDAHFAVGNFIADALNRDRIEIKGTGTPVRSYLYIGDAILWLLGILQRGAAGSAYNVGSEEPYSIRDLALLSAETLAPGKPVIASGSSKADNDRSYYVPETSRAQALGLLAWTNIRQAIEMTARYHRLHVAHRLTK